LSRIPLGAYSAPQTPSWTKRRGGEGKAKRREKGNSLRGGEKRV